MRAVGCVKTVSVCRQGVYYSVNNVNQVFLLVLPYSANNIAVGVMMACTEVHVLKDFFQMVPSASAALGCD